MLAHQGLVLRLDPPLPDDRRGAAADGDQRRAQANRLKTRRPTCAEYLMLAHGCHLVDTARYLAGDIVSVRARLVGAFWRALLVRRDRVRQRHARPPRPDGGGAHGLARRLPDLRPERQRAGQDLEPLVLQAAATSTSSTKSDGSTRRVLGADGHFYRRQVEGFADVILNGATDDRRQRAGRHRLGAGDGRHCAQRRDRVNRVRAGRCGRGPVMQLGIFSKTFDGTDPAHGARPP